MPEHERPDPAGRLSIGRTGVAILAGWLLPGLGHALLHRIRRGVLFGAVVFACFGLGVAYDGRLALRDPGQPILSTLQLGANLGVGPADVLARWAAYGRPAYALSGVPGHPGSEELRKSFRNRARTGASNYGTAYLWTAGLMNLLLLLDVWDIARRGKA